MSKSFVRKIIAAILFILSVFFIWHIFSANPENQNDTEVVIYFGASVLSVLFLFVLVFTLQTDIIYKEKELKKDEDVKSEISENNKSETGIKIKKLVEGLRYLKYPENFSEDVLNSFAKEFYIVQGMMYVKDENKFKVKATYAKYPGKNPEEFSEGEGLPGQAAKNKKIMHITDIPENYINVISGFGAGSASSLILIPFVKNNETVAVMEAASFESFPKDLEKYHSELNKLAEKLKS